MPEYIIAPSILSADFARLGEEVTAVLEAGADWIHFDVMDNHYVPNLTIGPLVCKALRDYGVKAPIDVHLMVKPVDDLIKRFADVGANSITFHPEGSEHVDRSLQLIRDQGCMAGLALNPATPLSHLDHVLDKLDFILIMTVNPGFGGQTFIPSMIQKIQQAKEKLSTANHLIRIAVDGGVNLENLEQIAKAGADIFVAGTSIYGTSDYRATLQKMREVFSAILAS